MEPNKKYGWLKDSPNIARTMGRVWQIVKSGEINIKTKRKLLLGHNEVSEPKSDETKPPTNDTAEEMPEEIMELKEERDIARKEKDWQRSDELREEIERGGYIVEEKDGETIIKKRV
ncbi:hypothetical protein M1307_02970 [Patescibacteria group bacterium]|nr:hypothetical protein [Patescibacteria group bacterium]